MASASPDVPTGSGRRWVLVGYMPKQAGSGSPVTLLAWVKELAALADGNTWAGLTLAQGREYRIAYDRTARRWCLFVR